VLSLSQLRTCGVELRPHEAVAIAQELITNETSHPERGAKEEPLQLDSVLISEDGTVAVNPACAGSLSIFDVGRLLEGALLQPGGEDVPGGLRYTIARALLQVEAFPFQSLDELSSALERFESGDRAEVIRGVVARADTGAPHAVIVQAPAERQPQDQTGAIPTSDDFQPQLFEADLEIRAPVSVPESPPPPVAPVLSLMSRRRAVPAVVVGALAVMMACGFAWLRWHVRPTLTSTPAAFAEVSEANGGVGVASSATTDVGGGRNGTLTIDTRRILSEVLVDGERRGTTPLTLALTSGVHTITVRSGSDERVVPLTIPAGTHIIQYFDMKAAEPVAALGRVFVATDPSGARVAIDGQLRGTSQLNVPDLTAAEHIVTVTGAAGTAERRVTVTAGHTASLTFLLPKVSGPVGGWVSIAAPFDVEVVENSQIIGTNRMNQIMLAVGRHDVMLMNRSLEYEEARTIVVTAGETMVIRIVPPTVPVSVNARPWAEIMLDGNSVGQTPIANLPVTVGPHEIVFRHPQFADRKQTVMVTAKGANRIATDFTK